MTPYDKLTIDDLLQRFQQRLPGFRFTLNTYGPGLPVNLIWNHTHEGYAAVERGVRSGWFPSVRHALIEVLGRYDDYDERERGDLDRREREQAEAAARIRAYDDARRAKAKQMAGPAEEGEDGDALGTLGTSDAPTSGSAPEASGAARRSDIAG